MTRISVRLNAQQFDFVSDVAQQHGDNVSRAIQLLIDELRAIRDSNESVRLLRIQGLINLLSNTHDSPHSD